MKLKCSNCGQTYNTKDLPPNVEWSKCPFCSHSSLKLSRQPQAGNTKPGKKGWLRTAVIMLLFFIPAIINYLEERKQPEIAKETNFAEQAAYISGNSLREAEEMFFDSHQTYTDDIPQLIKLLAPWEMDKGVTVSIKDVSQDEFTLITKAEGSSTTYVFKQLPPMHRAARSGNVDFLKILIEKGVDVNAPDESSHTPLYYARAFKQSDAEKLLKSNGATE